jgi:gamma-glutamylcyclotransferase
MAHNRYNPPVEAEAEFSAVYFGYGSNLSPRTLKQRCPDSLFIGLARLDDYRWQINSTGYANIVPSPGDVVYGSLCFLSNRDETALDESEGVPWLYEKHTLKVTRCGPGATEGQGDTLDAMTYVDVQRVEAGQINKEYVYWMNMAISYAEKYLRPFVPERKGEPEIMMVRTMIPKTLTPRVMPKGLAPVKPQ